VEISFPQIQARYINLTLITGDRARDWSVAELFVGRNLPRDDGDAARPGPADLNTFLEAHKIRTVYADHWLSAALRVVGGRQLRAMASNHFLGNNGENDPAPDQHLPVSMDSRTAFILEQGHRAHFEKLIRGGRFACEQRSWRVWEIYFNCRREEPPRLDRSNWKAAANANPEGAEKAVDGLPGTRWSSEKPQQPGQFFEVDLGKNFVVEGLALDLGDSPGDYPRRLRILGSQDAEVWREIETDWSSDFYWAGNVLLKMRGQRVDYFFDPRELRFLRLMQEGSDPRYFWSIHELQVYGRAPGRL
jgi:hypothetical protein